MALKRFPIQILFLLMVVVGITWLSLACSVQLNVSQPTPTIQETFVMSATPHRISPTVTVTSTLVAPTEDTCAEEIIFTRDNVRWVRWDTYLKEFVFEVEGNKNYRTYSIEERKETQQDIPYEQYQEGILAQFGIVGARFARLSPDGTKMIYSKSISIGPTLEPTPDTGGEVAVDVVSKIYLKHFDHSEYFLGELGGVVVKFEWSSDSTKIVITMSRDLSFDMERGLLYLLDLDDMSMDTLLSYPMVDSQDFGFGGFSNDDPWIFFGGDKNFMMNIHDGTKEYFQLPEKENLSWWGYDNNSLFIKVREDPIGQWTYSIPKFYWYDIKNGQLTPTSIKGRLINSWRSGVEAISEDFKYLALIDKNDLLSIIKIKTCQQIQ